MNYKRLVVEILRDIFWIAVFVLAVLGMASPNLADLFVKAIGL